MYDQINQTNTAPDIMPGVTIPEPRPALDQADAGLAEALIEDRARRATSVTRLIEALKERQ